MKKVFFTIILIGIINSVCAQWTFGINDNGFDTPNKYAYTETNNGAYLKFNVATNKYIFFSLVDDGDENNHVSTSENSDSTIIRVSLLVNNQWKKYVTYESKFFQFDDRINFTMYPDYPDKKSWPTPNAFINDFCNSSKIRIRIEYEDQEFKVFEFSMLNSKKAYNFIRANVD